MGEARWGRRGPTGYRAAAAGSGLQMRAGSGAALLRVLQQKGQFVAFDCLGMLTGRSAGLCFGSREHSNGGAEACSRTIGFELKGRGHRCVHSPAVEVMARLCSLVQTKAPRGAAAETPRHRLARLASRPARRTPTVPQRCTGSDRSSQPRPRFDRIYQNNRLNRAPKDTNCDISSTEAEPHLLAPVPA